MPASEATGVEAGANSGPQAKEYATVDWFIADVANATVEVTDELVDAMMLRATEYLLANGSVPWDRWAMLDPLSRAAFVEAAEAIRVRRALEAKP